MPIRLIILAIIVSSCNSGYHLRRAHYHLKKAEEKGAKVTSDTVWVETLVSVPSVRLDTVMEKVEFRDTIRIENERIRTKIKVNTIEKTVYVDVECKSDTIYIKTPSAIDTNITAPKRWYERWYWILLALLLGFVISFFVRR